MKISPVKAVLSGFHLIGNAVSHKVSPYLHKIKDFNLQTGKILLPATLSLLSGPRSGSAEPFVQTAVENVASVTSTQETIIKKFEGPHTKAVGPHPAYPARGTVSAIGWDLADPNYSPVDFTHKVVLDNDRTVNTKGWADPADFSLLRGSSFTSYQVPIVLLDSEGRPLNPIGRTGMTGRGLLGKFGANYAADPVAWRKHPITGELQFLLIVRKDTGEWAIPGGMVDEGEEVSQTLQREFNEEASEGQEVHLLLDGIVYRGYSDDPRNTDHAWMETTVAVMHVNDPSFEPHAGDDAAHAQWVSANSANLSHLFAGHSQFLRLSIQYLHTMDAITDASNIEEALSFAHPSL